MGGDDDDSKFGSMTDAQIAFAKERLKELKKKYKKEKKEKKKHKKKDKKSKKKKHSDSSSSSSSDDEKPSKKRKRDDSPPLEAPAMLVPPPPPPDVPTLPSGMPRQPDWNCPNCNYLVFASKKTCPKCQTGKPREGPSVANRMRNLQEQNRPDWMPKMPTAFGADQMGFNGLGGNAPATGKTLANQNQQLHRRLKGSRGMM